MYVCMYVYIVWKVLMLSMQVFMYTDTIVKSIHVYVCMCGVMSATWEEHYVGMFVLPLINGPSDGLAIAVSICLLSALYGAHWWTQVRHTSPCCHMQ